LMFPGHIINQAGEILKCYFLRFLRRKNLDLFQNLTIMVKM
jgi:hypothetical protein